MTDPVTVSKLPDSTDSLLTAALGYAALGFQVIPINSVTEDVCSCRYGDRCSAAGKHPRVMKWQKQATTDVIQIATWWKQWPNSNIGLTMGGQSRLVALDIDGPKGRNSLETLEEQHEQLPPTLTSRSGRVDGGEHQLFRVPEDFDITAISNRVNVASGLDVRAENGQIVVAPSMHASGRRYEWTQKLPPAPLPRWLYALMAPKTKRQPRTTYMGGLHPYLSSAINKSFNTVATALEGTRNNTLNDQAKGLGELVGGGVLERALAEQTLREAALRAGLGEKEIEATIKSGIEAGLKEPRGIPNQFQHTHTPTTTTIETNDQVPVVHLTGTFERQAKQVFEAVGKHNDPPFLFKRDRGLARIVPAFNQKVIEDITPNRLRVILQERFAFERTKAGEGGEPVPINLPLALMSYLVDQETWPLPELQSLIQAPVFIPPNAELADTDGYRTELQAYMDLDGFKPERGMPLTRAKELLGEWLHDFPFADASSRTHAIAFALTLLLRPFIKGNVPLFLVSAPVPGTGKSLLIQTLSSVVTGQELATMTETSDMDEWRKRITSILQTSPPTVLLDNINRKLNSDALASVITTRVWQDRRLGSSEMIRTNNDTVWVATANNPTMTGELARRCIWIHMDPAAERPWTRTGFLHPLPSWGGEHRTELFGAFVAVVESWKQAGRPLAASILGSFEHWAEVLGGVLQTAGFEGFLNNLEDLWNWNDNESRDWRAFTEAWWLRFQSMPVGVADLQRLAEDQDLLASVLGDGGERSRRIRLGRSLGQRVDRVFGQHVIRRSSNNNRKISIYRLVEI